MQRDRTGKRAYPRRWRCSRAQADGDHAMKALLSAILSKAGGALFTLALVAYLGHAIDPEASGYFYFTLAVAVMLSQLLRLGMDGVVLRLASRYHHAGETDALQRLAGDMLAYLLGGGAILILLGKVLEGIAA